MWCFLALNQQSCINSLNCKKNQTFFLGPVVIRQCLNYHATALLNFQQHAIEQQDCLKWLPTPYVVPLNYRLLHPNSKI